MRHFRTTDAVGLVLIAGLCVGWLADRIKLSKATSDGVNLKALLAIEGYTIEDSAYRPGAILCRRGDRTLLAFEGDVNVVTSLPDSSAAPNP